MIRKFLIWVSGADKNILSKCSRGEQSRIVNLGALILVPAITGLISMTFCISTFFNKDMSEPTEPKYYYISFGIGLIWFIVVLLIDRYLVSTFKKEDKIIKDVFSLKFIIRIIFAIGVGIAVSHPLVLFFFNDSIKQENFLEQKIYRAQELKSLGNNVDTAEIKYLKAKQDLDSLHKLYIYETTGVLIPGVTSGKRGSNGPFTDSLRKRISEKESEVKEEKSKALIRQNAIFKNAQIDSLKYANAKESDYMTRVSTLDRIEKKEGQFSQISIVRKFLMLFLILIDIIPLLFKVITHKREYDIRLEDDDHKIIKAINEASNFDHKVLTELYAERTKKMTEALVHFKDMADDMFLTNLKDIFNNEKFQEFIFTKYAKTQFSNGGGMLVETKPKGSWFSFSETWNKAFEDIMKDAFKQLIIGVFVSFGATLLAIIKFGGGSQSPLSTVIFGTLSSSFLAILLKPFKEVEKK